MNPRTRRLRRIRRRHRKKIEWFRSLPPERQATVRFAVSFLEQVMDGHAVRRAADIVTRAGEKRRG